MPREQITFNPIVEQHFSRQTYTDPDVPDAIVSVETTRRNVHVAWNRQPAGWVQIGIDVTVAELRDMLEAAEKEATAEARRVEHMGELDVDNFQYRVVSDVLDRAEVNSAITTLRRARDAAYGKDA